jgi:hypothetical protein
MERVTVAFKLNDKNQARLEKLTAPKRGTSAAIARYLLERAVEGSLKPELTRITREAKQITVATTPEFKAQVDAIRGATPVSELIEALLDAYEAEQAQGDSHE